MFCCLQLDLDVRIREPLPSPPYPSDALLVFLSIGTHWSYVQCRGLFFAIRYLLLSIPSIIYPVITYSFGIITSTNSHTHHHPDSLNQLFSQYQGLCKPSVPFDNPVAHIHKLFELERCRYLMHFLANKPVRVFSTTLIYTIKPYCTFRLPLAISPRPVQHEKLTKSTSSAQINAHVKLPFWCRVST